MQTVTLKATPRQGTGKSVTRKLRAAGIIPANLYGGDEPAKTMQVEAADMLEIFRFHGSNVLVEITLGDDEPVLTLVREHQIHPVSAKSVHLDFERIRLGKPLNVIIPITIVGESQGVKAFGGVLEQIIREIEVSCLPREIPDSIIVDVSELEINDSIHVGDLKVENVEFQIDASQTIVLVAPPRLSTLPEDEVEGEEGEGEEGEAAEGAEASGEGDAEKQDS